MLSQEAKGVLLDNPDFFLAHFFPHRLRELKPFHLELIRYATEARLGLIFYPAGHGKTTIVSELLPIWAICKDPNIRIANIAKDEKAAQDNTRSIQSELMQNEPLIEAFGPFKPEDDSKAWSLTRFDVEKRSRRGRSSTFAAFGAGSRGTLGYRSDWSVCDDVVTDKNSETPEQRDKLKQWFNQGPRTMAEGASGRLTVVGTLFHPEDLYHDLREQVLPDSGEPMWKGETFSAVTDWDTQEVLWPEERPWLWLMEQKVGFGTLDFNKRYCNVAVDASRMVFRDEYIRGGWVGKQKYPGCLDRHYVIGDYSPDWRRVSGFDPAVGTRSRSSKFCAHVVLAAGSCQKHERCYWFVDIERDQMTLPQQVDVILAKHEKYDLNKSMIEANSYQAGLFQAVQHKMGEAGVRYDVQPHYTSRTNKPDPELGVQAMSPIFENGEVHIPWGNPASQRKMQVLVDELIQYPGRTTDTVMATWFAWKQLQESAPKFMSFNRLDSNAKTKFWGQRPMRGRVVKNPIYVKSED